MPTIKRDSGRNAAVDLNAITAIDMHVHAEASIKDKEPRHGHTPFPAPNAQEIADYYRNIGMACVVFPVDAERMLGTHCVPNEEVADVAAANPDVMIPFGSIDPGRGASAPRTARRLVEEYGTRGFKFHPGLQEFFPNDQSAYPLFAALEELQVPALFHTGQSGGGRVRLKYSDPIYLDDVAVDFPNLTIIMAHPSFPWQDTALSVASRRENVYIDLSGWSPKYFPPQLVQYANTLLKEKVMFGSDYPVIEPERWLKDFEDIDIRDAVRPAILKDNAARLLGLTGATQ
ncbi:amidohydrolase family protein [Arthrobacter sp. 2MCAF15]|uniref:amidohydrolase family protein n=1 Tax=Arthrobacter sp. 2MCAF15 TaxID=3232984 RepID=UPI003F90CB2F